MSGAGTGQQGNNGNVDGVNGLIAAALQNSDSIPEDIRGDGDGSLGDLAQNIIDAQEKNNPDAGSQSKESEQSSTPSPEELQEIINNALLQAEEQRRNSSASQTKEGEPTVEDVQKLIADALNSDQSSGGSIEGQGNGVNADGSSNLVAENPNDLDDVGRILKQVLSPDSTPTTQTTNRRADKRQRKRKPKKERTNKRRGRKRLRGQAADLDNDQESNVVRLALKAGSAPSTGSEISTDLAPSANLVVDPPRRRNGRRSGRGGAGRAVNIGGEEALLENGAAANRLRARDADSFNSQTGLEAAQSDKQALRAAQRRLAGRRNGGRLGWLIFFL